MRTPCQFEHSDPSHAEGAAFMGAPGSGADISSARMDDLDLMALEFCRKNPGAICLDCACGSGTVSAAMAAAGARVTAFDIHDTSSSVRSKAWRSGVEVGFSVCDMREAPLRFSGMRVGMLFSQRAIHYLPRSEALSFLSGMRRLCLDGAGLFLSASGIGSELGAGYGGAGLPVGERFHPLEPSVAERHGILLPVCLYSKEELEDLVFSAGFETLESWVSDFGNIKLKGRAG